MDIYFTPQWGKLGELVEGGKAQAFACKTEYGRIRNQFILREIPWQIGRKQYYDIVTPYGYGGPCIEYCADGEVVRLLAAYEKEFSGYCSDNGIVSEFVRFHPIEGNGATFREIYGAQCIRHTVGTDLTRKDPIKEEFSKKCRKHIRQALNRGISYEVVESPESLEEFMAVYYSTMNRNAASCYYYFGKVYFDECIRYFKDNIILINAIYEGKTVASGMYFVWDSVVHIHLSGTLSEYLYLSPAYVLRYAITNWAMEHGCRLIHHGGGRSNDPEDSLYLFKKQFGMNTGFDFYVGRKTWDREIYNTLCEIRKIKKSNNEADVDYFPEYRRVIID